MKIPESLLLRPYAAIIVPAFEYLPRLKIPPFQFESTFKQYLTDVPTTKRDLAACMLAGPHNCTIFRDKAHLHEYLITDWFESSPSLAYEVPCLPGDRQEP